MSRQTLSFQLSFDCRHGDVCSSGTTNYFVRDQNTGEDGAGLPGPTRQNRSVTRVSTVESRVYECEDLTAPDMRAWWPPVRAERDT